MTSSTTIILNSNSNNVSSLFFDYPSGSRSSPFLSSTIRTPKPSPNLFLSRRRRSLHPPTLQKRKHCANYDYNSTPTIISTTLPIQTNNLPCLVFGDDSDNYEANKKKRNRNSFVFPPLPRIKLKKRMTTNSRVSHYNCFLSSSPQDFYYEDTEEAKVREQPPPPDEEEVTQAQTDQDFEVEVPASRRSTKTITKHNNNNNNNNRSSSMKRSASLQFSLSLMNLSTAANNGGAAAVGCSTTARANCSSSSSSSMPQQQQQQQQDSVLESSSAVTHAPPLTSSLASSVTMALSFLSESNNNNVASKGPDDDDDDIDDDEDNDWGIDDYDDSPFPHHRHPIL